MELGRAKTRNEDQAMSTKDDDVITYDGFTISELPEDICSLILSFLPFRDGIKTRVLSKKWRNLSALPSNLQFDQLNVFGTQEVSLSSTIEPVEQCLRFAKIVDQFLQKYKCGKIHSLELSYFLGSESAKYIESWICFAVEKKVETLQIDLSDCGRGRHYLFPCDLLACASHLKYLRFRYCILISSTPSYVVKQHYLNSLKTIIFEKVNLLEEDAFNTVLSGCGSLQHLRLYTCLLPLNFHICGPPQSSGTLLSIESLDILNCIGAAKIEISSVRVAFLQFVDVLPRSDNHPTVVELAFTGVSALMERLHYSVLDFASHGLPQDLNQLQYLSLHLYSAKIQRAPAKLHNYYHITELKTTIDLTTHFNIFAFAARILDVCPYLQKFCLIIVSTKRTFERDQERLTEWEYTEPSYDHLREFKIIGFCGDRCNRELVLAEHVLHNAVRLETMSIIMCRAAEQVISFANGFEMKQIHSILKDIIYRKKLPVKLSVRDSSHFPNLPSILSCTR